MTDEAFIKKMGWRKIKGYYYDLEEMRDCPDYWDKFYFSEDDKDDFAVPCVFFVHEEIEEAHEEMDDIIEKHYEEYMDEVGNVYDEPVEKKWLK